MEGLAVSPTTIVLGGAVRTLGRWGVAGLIGLVLLIGAALLLARGRLLA